MRANEVGLFIRMKRDSGGIGQIDVAIRKCCINQASRNGGRVSDVESCGWFFSSMQ